MKQFHHHILITKIVYLFLFSFLLKPLVAQQDPQYSLYQFNQMAINPAYAGARDAIAVVMDMRKQWVSFPGAPTTIDATIHAPVLNNKMGLGVNVLSDQIGAKSTSAAYGNVAYIAKLSNRVKLSFGLRAGYINYKFNFNKVNYKDANEPVSADLSNINKGAFDMDAGLFLRSNTFYLGLSATHLNRANVYNREYTFTNNFTGVNQNTSSSYALQTHLFLVMGKAFTINENFVFSPSIMIRSVASKGTADLNLNFLLKQRMWLGVFIKQGYGAGLLFQIYATDKLRIGYAYDAGLGSSKVLGSSHELMIGFDFGKYKAKTVSPRFL